MSRRSFVICMGLGLLGLSGCGKGSIKDLSKAPWVPETATWPAFEELFAGSDGYSLNRALRFKGAPNVNPQSIDYLSDPRFQERLTKFETTPIPEPHAGESREKIRKEIISTIKRLQGAPGQPKLAPTEVGYQLHRLHYLQAKMRFIPGQKVPEGAEAAKYQNVFPPEEPVEPVDPKTKKKA